MYQERSFCMEISGLQALVLIHDNPLIPHAIIQPSVIEKICGQPAIIYTTKLLESLNIAATVVVSNANQSDSQADQTESDSTPELTKPEQIRTIIQQYHDETIHCISQDIQATSATNPHTLFWRACTSVLALNTSSDILVIQGCMPLLSAELIKNLYTQHRQTNAAISFVTTHNADPNLIGYERSMSDVAQDNCCINAGIYMVQRSFLEQIGADTADLHGNDLEKNSVNQTVSWSSLIKKARDEQKIVTTVMAPFDTLRAIHTFQELWAVEHIKSSSLITHWMNKGVRFAAPQTVHIDLAVTVGTGSYIGSGVHLFGATTIGARCQIHEFSSLEQVTLGDNSRVYSHCVMKKSRTGAHAQIGPFAHVNGDNSVGDHATIGNFVEIKRSSIGIKTKVKHLSYLGDAHIGNEVNIGAGTITCNHDGFTKHITTIEDNAYIGTNTTLIAPLKIGNDAFTAAGSTITKDVPSYALALARTRQINKEGYVHVLREKKQKALLKQNTLQSHTSSSVDDTASRAFIGAVKPSPENNSADRI